MKRWILGLLLLGIAGTAWAGLEFQANAEGEPGAARRLTDVSSRRQTGAVRLAEGKNAEAVRFSSDVPEPLRARSRASLAFAGGGMFYFRDAVKFNLEPAFSLSLWLRPEGRGDRRQTVLLRTGDWNLDYLPARGTLEFAPRGAKQPATLKLPAGRWSHVVLVRQGKSVRWYLDGRVAGGIRTLDLAPGNSGQLYLGGGSSRVTNSWCGGLDELTIWNHPLTPADVAKLAAGADPASIVDGSKLTRTPTKEFPADLKLRPLAAALMLTADGRPAASIAVQTGSRNRALAELVQRRLAAAWGVTFPIRHVTDHADGREALILVGPRNGDMLLRELTANGQWRESGVGGEYRIFPEALDWRRGVLYLGGRDEAEVEEALALLLKRYPRPEPMKFGGETTAPQSELPEPEALTASVRELFAGRSARQINTVLLTPLKQAAQGWRDRGDGRYARAFGDIVKLLLENYAAKQVLSSNAPPTFEFHQFPQYLYLVENAPEFTAADRRNAAELIRMVLEQTMDYWEMAVPARMYAEGRIDYLTNHYNFAARTTYNGSRWLLDRLNFQPARYWQTVALHVFAGVQDHPFSPEDAGGYQFLVYRIFTDFALSSGRYRLDFFRRKIYRDYVEFTKGIFNHLGYTPGYGDANATGMASGYTLLKEAVDILGDEEAEFLLGLISRRSGIEFYRNTIEEMRLRDDLPPPDRPGLRGLNVFPFDRFRQRLANYPDFRRPVVNKAIFRSSWQPDADFLAINGLTGAPHGHDDAAGIGQYIHGDRLWIFEGDYIKRFAEDHNVLQVIRDGLAPDRRRNYSANPFSKAAQLVAAVQTPARDFALLTLLLQDYNGVDQKRHFGWEAGGGFWVVDEVAAKLPGDYLLFNRFRTTGVVTPAAQGMVVTQKPDGATPNRFAVAEGGRAERFFYSRHETCHGRPATVLPGYRFSDRMTRTLLQRRAVRMEKGDTVRQFHYLRPFAAEQAEPPVAVRMLSEQAALADDGVFPRLAAQGALKLPGLEVDADLCFLSPSGVTASGVRKFRLNGRALTPEADGTLAAAWSEADAAALQKILTAAARKAGARPAPEPAELTAPELTPFRTLDFEAPVTAEAVADGRIAVGRRDGGFSLHDADGRELAARKFAHAVSMVAPLDLDGRRVWLVGVRGPWINSITEVSDGELHCLDADGRELWKFTVPNYQRRYGVPTTAFAARLDGADKPLTIVVGVEAQRYFFLSPDGRELRVYQATHGATCGAAGDLNGDGFDEIFAGVEYYYHDIVDRHGKRLSRRTTSPWDLFCRIADFDGNGRPEVAAARMDGWLYTETLGENPLSGRAVNLGGLPTGMVELAGGAHRLATVTDSGIASFLDGSLRRTGYLTFPAPLSSLARSGDRLWTVGLDGRIYRFTAAGVEGRGRIVWDPAELRQPQVAADDQVVAVSAGRRVQLYR